MATFLSAETDTTAFDLKKIWNDIVTFFTENYWNVLLFFAVLVIGIIVIKLLVKLFRRILARSKMAKIAQSFLVSIVKYLLYLAFVLALLAILGVNLNGILTALSAAILAVGMALQNNIANLANGIVIVSSHMLNEGDFIQVGDVMGTVKTINFLFTTVNTTDNKRVYIPNSTIVNSSVTNYGINGTRRVDFTFSVSYDADVELVKKTVIEVMLSFGKIKEDPKPFCRLKTLNASSVDFFANCWCNAADYWDVYYYVTENVFNEFKRKNISIPYAQTEVRIRTDEVHMPVAGDKLPEREELPPEVPLPQYKNPLMNKLKTLKDKLDEE